ncbi:MAG: hypothetical protein KJ666_09375 [Bacteroidetes bacterium]|nr:hypothetical protein [Bacteroidota bacterium]
MKEHFKYRSTRLPHEVRFGGQESIRQLPARPINSDEAGGTEKICKPNFPARYAVGGEAGGLEQAHS